jgi:hypothetical protein
MHALKVRENGTSARETRTKGQCGSLLECAAMGWCATGSSGEEQSTRDA